jgi:predicted Zn-dependent peptidase
VSFKKTHLQNGLTVVSEFHPQPRSVSLGVWVNSGTRHENSDEHGLSHLIEHLVFKGTKNRTAYQIAKSLESLGGDLNAYTSKEYTCLHSLTLKEHWTEAVQILADLTCHARLNAKDFKTEKNVILQEIAMSEDQYEEAITDLLFSHVYSKHPLSIPILGTAESLKKMNLRHVFKRYKQIYSPQNIILSAAGPIDHSDFVEQVIKNFKFKAGLKQRKPKVVVPRWKASHDFLYKDIEQTHCLWAFPVGGFKADDRFEAFIVNAALGGGMSSRLYQSVREKRGLVYTIYSSLMTFVDTGLITIYAAADHDEVKKINQLVLSELQKLIEKGLSSAEIEMFKTQIIGSLLIGSEDMESRMTSIGVNEMTFGRYRSVQETVENIQKIDARMMKDFLKKRVNLNKLSSFVLGHAKESLC